MEYVPQPKARLIVNVMEHGTVVGTDDPVSLEFEDCGNAVGGLVSWLAGALAEVNDADPKEIGTAILVDALHHWTFDEDIDEEDEFDDEFEDEPGNDPD
ncbi:MAG: hypothetical protein JSW27_07380 [Phycisphaerales bacterium]|nr:MAG: hypothetical protein JSW27_07380 [Phycisphaerales bacterium]